jgi:hypothetical protein
MSLQNLSLVQVSNCESFLFPIKRFFRGLIEWNLSNSKPTKSRRKYSTIINVRTGAYGWFSRGELSRRNEF